MKTKKIKKAFTLVELMIVIAIIGILAGLIFPAFGPVLRAVDKMTASSYASSIAKGWIQYTRNSTVPLLKKENIYLWAAVLAEKQDLNTPKLWCLTFDELVGFEIADGGLPNVVVDIAQNGDVRLNQKFANLPISWQVANGTPASAKSSTPLLWTRGLKFDGRWDADMGVFKSEGGHIVFVDGSVQWFSSLKKEGSNEGVLNVYGSTTPTFNIVQAIFGKVPTNILTGKIPTGTGM